MVIGALTISHYFQYKGTLALLLTYQLPNEGALLGLLLQQGLTYTVYRAYCHPCNHRPVLRNIWPNVAGLIQLHVNHVLLLVST